MPNRFFKAKRYAETPARGVSDMRQDIMDDAPRLPSAGKVPVTLPSSRPYRRRYISIPAFRQKFIVSAAFPSSLPTPVTAKDDFGALSRALADLAKQLEEKIAELTSQRDRLKRLETMRRDFVANVSHELRTPVTAIRGFAETLLARDGGGGADATIDDGTRREFIETIHRIADRVGRLVDDLLRLANYVEPRVEELAVRELAAQPELRDELLARKRRIYTRFRTALTSARIDQVLARLNQPQK